jgi:hypothetical protein
MRTSQKLHIGQVRDWLLLLIVVALVMSAMYPLSRVHADDRNRPVRIGVLTDSWGPTPTVVGLRDGLTALGYWRIAIMFLACVSHKETSKHCPLPRANSSKAGST